MDNKSNKRNITINDVDIINNEIELIDNININSCTDNGKNLLHYAWNGYSIKTINALLDKGIDLDKQDNYGNTPLHNLFGYTPLYNFYLRIEIAKLLIESGANMNIQNNYNGYTFLHNVVLMNKENKENKEYKEYIEFIEFIVKKGANPYITDKYGYSSFDMTTDKEICDIFYNIHNNCKVARKL
jgi:ankyrin repeat protein